MNSEERMLHDIGIADFVLTDLMLYLDTHPTDRNAMEYFNHYTTFWAAASGKDDDFAIAQQSLRLKANQYKRDALQTLLEQKQISAKTLKEIQQALLYDEMVLAST